MTFPRSLTIAATVLLAGAAAVALYLFTAGCTNSPGSAKAGGASLSETSAPVMSAYLEMHEALANDSTSGVSEAAERLGEAVKAVPGSSGLDPEQREAVAELVAAVESEAAEVASARGLAALRESFKSLSEAMIELHPFLDDGEAAVVHCPMKDGRWLQRGTTVTNPYHGSEMLRCGRVVAQSGGHAEGHTHESHGHGHGGHGHDCPGHGHDRGSDGHDCPGHAGEKDRAAHAHGHDFDGSH